MKKILLGLALSFFLLTSASASEFNQNLRFGSKGSEVKKLQEFLADQGLYNGPITGNFFSLTLKAVKSFQSANGIVPLSGYFGLLTRTKANEILDSQLADLNSEANEPVVEPKTTDDVVSKLNEQIGALNNQNQLLQQIVNQTAQPVQAAPVVNEPIVEPVLNPGVSAKRVKSDISDNMPDRAVLELNTKDDSFLISAISVSIENTKLLRDTFYSGGFITPSDVWQMTSFQPQNCFNLNGTFKEHANSPFPYTCLGKDVADFNTFENLPEIGYGQTAIDWFGRHSYFYYTLEKNKSYKIYLPTPAKFDYIKLIGKETGKVIELRDL